jgi:hypothetical protein
VVAHVREEWWLMGTVNLQSWVQIQQTPQNSGLPVLRWAAIWDGNFTVGCPLRVAEGNINKKGLLVYQKQ